jgi:predicted metal-dependent phosphoesterase TrpH
MTTGIEQPDKLKFDTISGAMLMKYANLHLHTTHSDGVLSTQELCCIAKDMGYGAIAITDHFDVGAWQEVPQFAKEFSLDYIFGMEADGIEGDKTPHIVAYDFDPSYPAMAEFLQYRHDVMYASTFARFQALTKQGLIRDITWQDVEDNAPQGRWINNEHVFVLLVRNGLLREEDYYPVFCKAWHGVQDNVPETKRLDAKEMIRIIRAAGGVASLAHPHNLTHLLPTLYRYGLNCVEIDHPDIDETDAREAYTFAKANRMYVSGGTDHTGRLSNHPHLRGNPDPMGDFLQPLATDVRCGVTKEEFDALKSRIYG